MPHFHSHHTSLFIRAITISILALSPCLAQTQTSATTKTQSAPAKTPTPKTPTVEYFNITDWQENKAKEISSSAFAIEVYNTFDAVLSALEDKYLSEVQIAPLVASGFESLKEVEPNLTLTLETNKLALFLNNISARSIPYTSHDSGEKWAKAISSALITLKTKSAKIDALSKDEIYEKFLGAMLARLDPATRYFPPRAAAKKKAKYHGTITTNQRFIPAQTSAPLTMRNDIAIIKIDSFNTNTQALTEQALSELYSSTKGVIIDLTGSKGGILNQATGLADSFLDEGEIIKVLGRNPDSIKHYDADEKIIWTGPLVILIDKNTLSSAEAFALAMQKNGRALIIGEKSRGKGTTQIAVPLPNGGEVMLSWAKIYAADGTPLNGEGVTPDIIITGNSTEEIRAEATRKAIEWLGEPPAETQP